MNDGMKEYKRQMVSDPMFQQIIRNTVTQCPKIPAHCADPDNTDKWKQLSAMKRGYELAFLQITGLKLGDIHE